ncbi:MAG TPA: glycosyltransferase family 1 protein [Candidatus Atribacteria bacterium]|nr:glycosyltransferase family 1 protein [Candidatus Atribacteria bacterium]
MKICFVGVAKSIHVQRWVKWFAERGHEVHLISPYYAEIDGIKLHETSRKKIKFINFVREAFKVRKLVWKIKPDILHAHYVTSNGFFAAFANYHPFLVSVWGSDILREAKESFIKKNIIGYSLKKADIVIPTARSMVTYLTNEFALSRDKIVRIPWGIDLKIFHRGYEKEVEKLRKKLKIGGKKWVVLSPRGMRPNYSNNHLIMEAIPLVIKKHPNTIFIFLRGNASASFEEEMKKKVSKLGIDSNVRFISSFLSPPEMAIYYNMSDIMLSLPYTDQFAFTIMEGVVCGSIPIVSNIDVYKQYLTDGKNAFYVDPDDPKELAEKIIYCIEHPEIKESFYKINRTIIEENENWDKNTKKMEKLYEKLVKAGRVDR